MIREVDPQVAAQLQREGAIVVDVREPYEWAQGHVSGAQLIPSGELPRRFQAGALPRESEILFICASGARSWDAASLAEASGYHRVASVVGGTSRWRQLGLPIERGPR